LINDLRKQPLFQKAMQKVREAHRPIVPNFNPSKPISVDEWKYASGRQDGFDFLYALLVGDKDGRSND